MKFMKFAAAALAFALCAAAHAQFEMMSLKSNSKTRGDKPTFINADAADIDIANNKATFMGNVKVDDPDMLLTCRKLVIYLTEQKRVRNAKRKNDDDDLGGGKRLSKIECMEDVVITRKANLASGDRQQAFAQKAIYDVANGSIKLSGPPRPVIVSGKSKMSGETITLFTDTERVEITFPKIEAVNLNTDKK